MLDADLAALYGVETKALVRAVKRNRDRFPDDFMFQLSVDEFADLRRQSGTSSPWGGRRYRPYAFTEQGVAMLSSVLRSPGAVRANIEIMRAFVRLRQILASNAELAQRLDALEKLWPHRATARAALSVPTTIAEGAAKRGPREFRRFLDIALGSLGVGPHGRTVFAPAGGTP